MHSFPAQVTTFTAASSAAMQFSDHQLTPSVRVLLWTAPRCMSSAFERSIRELEAVKVIYEPHQQAYYHGPERRSDNNNPTLSEINPTATFKAADDRLLQQYDEYEAVFAKNMAYFVKGSYERYTTGKFASFKHTFLIRNPRKSIPSFVKACEISNFPPSLDETGFKELYDLFKVVQLVDPNPIVVDADDLLANPRDVMEQYCHATGLPFSEKMLTWTPGEVSDWKEAFVYYKEWHGTAMMSSGFMKPKASKDTQPAAKLRPDIEEAVCEALPYYQAIHDVRLRSLPKAK